MSVTSVVCKEVLVGGACSPAPAQKPKQQQRQQQQPKQKRVCCGMAEVGPVAGALQIPLRGPAQPLAAVRSGACEAVLRKQSALTHVSSVAASMRLTPRNRTHRLRQISAICGRSTPCVDESPSESNISNWIPKHPRMAWIYRRPRSTLTRSRRNSSEVGRCRVRVSAAWARGMPRAAGRTPNPGLAVCAGKRTRASGCQTYKDVLAASPHSDTVPPTHG